MPARVPDDRDPAADRRRARRRGWRRRTRAVRRPAGRVPARRRRRPPPARVVRHVRRNRPRDARPRARRVPRQPSRGDRRRVRARHVLHGSPRPRDARTAGRPAGRAREPRPSRRAMANCASTTPTNATGTSARSRSSRGCRAAASAPRDAALLRRGWTTTARSPGSRPRSPRTSCSTGGSASRSRASPTCSRLHTWFMQRRPADRRAVITRPRRPRPRRRDVELLHREHRLHGALRLRRVGVAHDLLEPGRHHLPRQAVPVLEPPALALLAARR